MEGGRRSRKYLRMRGEERGQHRLQQRNSEIPPHARRRAAAGLSRKGIYGNTSACAEKRNRGSASRRRFRKYLRMRGEERADYGATVCLREIPPHARRRVIKCRVCVHIRGNTSACAEKSFLTWGFIFCGAGFSTARVIRCWQGGGHPCQ